MPISGNEPFYVGADGCRAGWFAIVLTEDGQWRTEVFPNIVELWEQYRNASLILLDVPIGLKEKGVDERRCDREAQKLLRQPRAASVFRAPCRRAIYATNKEKAKYINKQLTGKSLPEQALGIVPKIRDVDSLLLSDANARPCIKEVHPELCFWALAGGLAMQHKKGTASGFSERLQVLQSHHSRTNAIVSHALNNYRRKDVKKDDILDALVAGITALGGLNALVSLPDPPEFDDQGLPMQMLYRTLNAS